MGSKSFSGLEFGEGGGFSGIVKTYKINSKGIVSQHNSFNDSTRVLTKLKKKELRTLVQKLETLGIDSLDFYHPGNFYYFLKYNEVGGQEKKVVWGDLNHPVPNAIKVYYQSLFVRIPEIEAK